MNNEVNDATQSIMDGHRVACLMHLISAMRDYLESFPAEDNTHQALRLIRYTSKFACEDDITVPKMLELLKLAVSYGDTVLLWSDHETPRDKTHLVDALVDEITHYIEKRAQ